MKKALALLLSMVMACSLLVGCGSKPSDNSGDNSGNASGRAVDTAVIVTAGDPGRLRSTRFTTTVWSTIISSPATVRASSIPACASRMSSMTTTWVQRFTCVRV